MAKIRRTHIREFLLQALYGQSVLGESFDLIQFARSYYTLPFETILEEPYFYEMYTGIRQKEPELLDLIKVYAPKFDPTIMPLVNLLPIFIGAYEMLYLKADEIPENVSLNEAVELAKQFSDDGARELVNWVLNAIKWEKDLLRQKNSHSPRVFFIL